MPAVIPAVVAAVGQFLGSSAVLATLAKAVLGIAATALTAALGPKPAVQKAGGEIRLTTRDSQAKRVVVNGKVRKGGTLAFWTTTNNRNHLHLVVALAGHECSAIHEIYFDDELAFDADGNVTKKYRNHAFVSKHLGSPTQAADPELVARVPEWTQAHRGQSVCYLYVRLVHNTEKFHGYPNISAVIEGKELFDPRLGDDVYTDNAALCIADHLHDPIYGLDIPYDNTRGIDPNVLMASANLCDEMVSIPGGQEKRYTLNGVTESGQMPQTIIENMLTACAGNVNYVTGKWYVQPGQFTAPVVNLTDADLRGGLQTQTGLNSRDLCNAIRGQFMSAKDNYVPIGFPPITSAVFEAQDNGQRNWRDIELPYTVTETEAQRLARIELFATREQISVTGTFGMKAFKAMVGDTISLTLPRMGWDAKPFRVTRWRLAMREQENGEGESVPEIVIEMTLRETSSAVYDVTASDLQLLAAAPDTNLPTPDTIGGGTIYSLPSQPNSVILSHQVYLTGQARIAIAEQFPAWRGDKQNLIKDPMTGKLIVDDTMGADGDNLLVFDNFVQAPFPVSYYESEPIMLRFEDLVRITAGFRAVQGPQETGRFSAHVEYDFHGDLDDFDGFERIGAGGVENAQLREFKMKIVFDSGIDGGFYLERFSPQAWKEAVVQGDTTVSIPVGGRTITFRRPYHNIPRIQVTPVASGNAVALVDARDGDGFTARMAIPGTGNVAGFIDWQATSV